MKQQVYLIGGGEVFEKYSDYLDYLRRYKIESLEGMQYRDWKSNLGEDLDEKFEVIFPKMPCKKNAKFLEWKIWAEKYFPFLRENVILIGHSLGASFWLKYLAEYGFPVKVRQLHLVAAPISDDKGFLGDFLSPERLDNIPQLAQNIFLYYSQNDPVVSSSDLAKISSQLPGAKQFIFPNYGHFRIEHFPELVRQIKSASSTLSERDY